MSDAHLTQIDSTEDARMLADHAVAFAVAFLDGRHSAWKLGHNAQALQHQLMTVQRDAFNNELLDPVGLLISSMGHTSRACLPERAVDTRQERWMHIMASFVDLIRAITSKARETTTA